jgi:ferredoxin-NADP reductase
MLTFADDAQAARPGRRPARGPEVPAAGQASPRGGAAAELELVVRAKERVADEVVMLTLTDPADQAVPEWRPGAHVDLILGDGLVRQYSLCGDPADRDVLRVAVLRESRGRGGSAYVHEVLRAGQAVRVRGPRNNFPLAEAAAYLFIAGGIGITPLLPMVAAVDSRGADWLLLYGGRRRTAMAFRAELQERYGRRVRVRPQDEAGLLDLRSVLGAPSEGTAVYCCGPEPLLAAVEEHCRAWPPGALRLERFAPRPAQAGGPDSAFGVRLARSGTVVTVPPHLSIVDAVAEVGVEIPTSCREGICGTCETAVLDGVPHHRDSLLTDEERAAGDVMFPCVSRCQSGTLVLDL